MERRGETLDEGLARLTATVTSAEPDSTLEGLISEVVTRLGHDSAQDDIAVLAVRWEPLRHPGPQTETSAVASES